MANIRAIKRLKMDYQKLMKDPIPLISAAPLPSNILEWHYAVLGPDDTDYTGGIYHGKLLFPVNFPFAPPTIMMITPSGRFEVNKRLCLSISDFHPETWNPAWSVGTILTGLLSFLTEETPTVGSLNYSSYVRKRMAARSLEFNLRDPIFCELFPELAKKCKETVDAYYAENPKPKMNTVQSSTLSQSPLNPFKNLLVISTSIFCLFAAFVFALSLF